MWARLFPRSSEWPAETARSPHSSQRRHANTTPTLRNELPFPCRSTSPPIPRSQGPTIRPRNSGARKGKEGGVMLRGTGAVLVPLVCERGGRVGVAMPRMAGIRPPSGRLAGARKKKKYVRKKPRDEGPQLDSAGKGRGLRPLCPRDPAGLARWAQAEGRRRAERTVGVCDPEYAEAPRWRRRFPSRWGSAIFCGLFCEYHSMA